ncbi:helix-turn-helix transcriptional regulator [Paenibacillus sp. HN-1]|uniref:ArsR/SmtB family transcription factor n=1 Tax=Paenibacillus TaxID=44249 RepID=UPI001CA993A4|nr:MULTISPECIES: metalloregulator ArsR/SmtB family transcription factor [Paenibacillus]MBY9079263.1 helix-turn-helix transcriptional regulator [Paenibacillus sp. CGMCC 1.18879]MBY9086986.1 helix-turn-helix transcriptional regulator [Paenibacillus sinensis]
MTIEQQTLLNDEQRVQIFKALADPTRLQIIRTLRDSRTELNCGEVGERCEASKSNASYHFRTLREAGLIMVRKEAQTKYIQIRQETFDHYLPGFLDTL